MIECKYKTVSSMLKKIDIPSNAVLETSLSIKNSITYTMPKITMPESTVVQLINTSNVVSSIVSKTALTAAEIVNNAILPIIESVSNSFKNIIPRGFGDSLLFMEIADEIGFPIYLEVSSELKERLLKSYHENNDSCNKEEMIQIILDYYNDDYVDNIIQNIVNVGTFNSNRTKLISEGLEGYKQGLYGCSASLFATQLSGMIRDLYTEICKIHKFTNREKENLKEIFKLENCGKKSEKFMLTQIISVQDGGALLWYKSIEYFLGVTYSSRENNMLEQPKRHMICHGIQTNYNTKEMNLKLIMCMDIISELAWRTKELEEEKNIVATV